MSIELKAHSFTPKLSLDVNTNGISSTKATPSSTATATLTAFGGSTSTTSSDYHFNDFKLNDTGETALALAKQSDTDQKNELIAKLLTSKPPENKPREGAFHKWLKDSIGSFRLQTAARMSGANKLRG